MDILVAFREEVSANTNFYIGVALFVLFFIGAIGEAAHRSKK